MSLGIVRIRGLTVIRLSKLDKGDTENREENAIRLFECSNLWILTDAPQVSCLAGFLGEAIGEDNTEVFI
jgi:hypothetical protein